jgi:hypothetical protein
MFLLEGRWNWLLIIVEYRYYRLHNVKVKLSLYLTKHDAMKTYEGVEV